MDRSGHLLRARPAVRGIAFLVALACLLSAVQHSVGGYNRGRRALLYGKWSRAAHEFLGSAESGNPKSQLMIGLLYHVGRGVERDPDKALSWIRRAAEKGLVEAESVLGLLLVDGLGVTQDVDQGAEWLRRAADHGSLAGALRLARLHFDGEAEIAGLDDATAKAWLEKAAASGSVGALALLGRLHYEGRGVERDPDRAYEFLRIPASDGHPEARELLARMYLAGDGVERSRIEARRFVSLPAARGRLEARRLLEQIESEMTPEEIDEVADLAAAAYEDGRYVNAAYEAFIRARDGRAAGQYNLALMFMNGLGVPRDSRRAYYWMLRASRQGYADSVDRLADIREHLSESDAEELLRRPEAEDPDDWGPGDLLPPDPLPVLPIAGLVDPRPIEDARVEPVYPEVARSHGIEAELVLEAVITADGRVDALRVVQSSKPGLGFEQAALDAVERWRYEPALRDGEPSAVTFRVEVNFELE